MPPATDLESAIRHSGEDWLIDWFDPPEEALLHLRKTLENANRRAQQLLGLEAFDLSEAALVRAYNENPFKVKGFFQVLGGTRSPDMLVMVWRVIQGMEIKAVEISYGRKQQFHARIVLESPDGAQDETYESSKIQDFALFRHIGIMEISGRPVFDGFYALKLTDASSKAG
ncbi:MAG TPA: hypothetical protein VHV55_09455 [Pirellulales bacterium]|nr:hypothetical protein [Pirellulales bacterium]